MQPGQTINSVLIVGGGTAGWITAGLLASEYAGRAGAPSVTLIESPSVATIGVGEGTWPTMRSTLQRIGISEAEFLIRCAASFKQGTRFDGWCDGSAGDRYYHPFVAPAGYPSSNVVPAWSSQEDGASFVDAVCVQGVLCDRDLAPKQSTTPEYAAVANYGYHLDAGAFAELLKTHCTTKLGVRHVLDHVTGIEGTPDEDIRALRTKTHGSLEADLFVDCSGFAGLLIGQHYGIGYRDCSAVLCNDSALAVHLPYADAEAPIASQTISTAQSAGWIWDIGLSSRRGAGFVYSSAYTSDDRALSVLQRYVDRTAPHLGSIEPRKLSFNPGHRESFWHRNCVAVGMAAGFLEPLEASALVLVELSARMISERLPTSRDEMSVVARQFNDKFAYRWQRIIDFLKLHYVLSQRDDSDYWRDHHAPDSLPDGLRELLTLWRYQAPAPDDFPQIDEVFSAASHQYVLYGMGFETRQRAGARHIVEGDKAIRMFADNQRKAQQLVSLLPSNRALLQRIAEFGLPQARVGQGG